LWHSTVRRCSSQISGAKTETNTSQKSFFATMTDPDSDMKGSNDNDSDSAASLDHTLLESLFYNEMMLLDESSFLSPDFMGSLTGDNGGVTGGALNNAGHSQNENRPNVLAEKDASTLAERDLLQHFGVSSRPFGTGPMMIAPSAAPVSAAFNGAVSTSAAQQQSTPAAKLTETAKPRIPQERAQHLVSQFATLASRLGISLPQNVLSSLTQQVEAKDAGFNGESPSPSNGARTFDGMSSAETSPNAAGPTLQHVQNTDDAAMSSVSEPRKRSHSDSKDDAKAPLYSKRRKKPRLWGGTAYDKPPLLLSLPKSKLLTSQHFSSSSQIPKFPSFFSLLNDIMFASFTLAAAGRTSRTGASKQECAASHCI
jgi:hypothetical protein